MSVQARHPTPHRGEIAAVDPLALEERKLSYREQLFAMEYLVDLDARRAAERAGYSTKQAVSIGRKLERDPAIIAAIDREMVDRARRVHIEQDHVVSELKKIAFYNPRDHMKLLPDGSATVDLTDLDRASWAALGEIRTEVYVEGKGKAAREVKRITIKPQDKLKALELLMKHYGMANEKNAAPVDQSITVLINQAQGTKLGVAVQARGGYRDGRAQDAQRAMAMELSPMSPPDDDEN